MIYKLEQAIKNVRIHTINTAHFTKGETDEKNTLTIGEKVFNGTEESIANELNLFVDKWLVSKGRVQGERFTV